MTSIEETVESAGQVRVAMYDAKACQALHPHWEALTKQEKLAFVRVATETGSLRPVATSTDTNTTCTGLHQFTVDALDASQPTPSSPDFLALGRDGTSPKSETDTVMDDHVDDVLVTSFTDEGSQVRITTFVDEGEANVDVDAGETLSECGLVAPDGLHNHSALSTNYAKDNTKTLTIEVTLSFSAQ